MDLLNLIKTRASIRKYQDNPIPKEILDKIIEAGIWGPSVVGMQTVKFIVIEKKEIIRSIASIIKKKSDDIGVGGNILMRVVSTINNAQLMIAVYNTRSAFLRMKGLAKIYAPVVKIAEVEAIAASIQNMILVAEQLGVGVCWLDLSLLCEKSINRLLNIKADLIATLTMGYPAEAGKRSPRRGRVKLVQYI